VGENVPVAVACFAVVREAFSRLQALPPWCSPFALTLSIQRNAPQGAAK